MTLRNPIILDSGNHKELPSGDAIAGVEVITAIDKIVASVNTVAVCYHEVAWDDDPDWIEKCQETSWYNETLNTSTRGKTRKFPAAVLIVAEADEVTIYDATDPDLPLWGIRDFTGKTIKSISFINAVLVVGTTTGLSIYNYMDESDKFITA